jgi:GH25 family lysozyme M1 (1,4-beta-N-acetylmuramidase)
VTLNGYDISAYQSGLNPAALPGDFIIIKATGGDGYVNPSWRQQLAAAKAAGKLVGVYHFARDGYTAATAHSEAQWFIRNCADVLDGTVMAVLDWEADNETDVAYAKAWLDEVTAATGVKPVIYMSFKTIQAANWAPVANADYGLWEAAYVLGYQRIDGYAVPGGRSAIPYWSSICMWQYTSSGYLPGWGSALDLDVFYGDASTWAAYCAKNGVILAATGTTPIQEDDMTPDQAAQLAYIASPQFKIDLWTATGAEADARTSFEREAANTLLNFDIPRQGGPTGTTNPGQSFAWLDANLGLIIAAVHASGATLTDAQVSALADKLGPDLIQRLAAQLQK